MSDAHDAATRYPLAWPPGWPRTPAARRRRALFVTVTRAPAAAPGVASRSSTRAVSVIEGVGRLAGELRRLGAEKEIVSTNIKLRVDGWPRSDQAEPADPAAAVYFALDGKPRVLACDRWTRTADNLAAIAAHIEAIRAVDRYGVGTLEQAFAGYAALPQNTAAAWWDVFGVDRGAPLADVEAAFRQLARAHHPDAGGSHEGMARLTEARAAARRELGG